MRMGNLRVCGPLPCHQQRVCGPRPCHQRVFGCRVPRLLPSALAARHSLSQVCLGRLLRLLVWASVRVLGAGRVEQRSNGGCWAQGVCRGQSSNRAVRESSGGDFGGGVCARCLEGLRDLKGNEKRKKWNRKWSSVDRKLRYAPDPGRLRRLRRFHTRKPWLLFLAFSTHLTRIASPGPMFAFIQIVHLRASSTRVHNKNQLGT